MVEWFKAAVLKTAEGQLSEGSNPSSSAIFLPKKMANEAARLHFTVPSGTTSLKKRSFFFTSSPSPREDLLVKSFPAPFYYAAASRFSHL